MEPKKVNLAGTRPNVETKKGNLASTLHNVELRKKALLRKDLT